MFEEAQSGRTRYFRVIEEQPFGAVFGDCPVQVAGWRTVTDIDTHEIFMSFTLLNTGKKPIRAAALRLEFYGAEALPFGRTEHAIDLSVPAPAAFVAGVRVKKSAPQAGENETFGGDRYFSLPDSYFKRVEAAVASVTFADGEKLDLLAVARGDIKRLDTLGERELAAYREINRYRDVEILYPAVGLPSADSLTWVCCCGAKNAAGSEKCSVCGRDRRWQFEHITPAGLEKAADDIDRSDDTRRYRAGELRAKTLGAANIGEKERREKARRDEDAIRSAEIQNDKAEKRRKHILAAVLIWLAAIGVYLILTSLFGR